MSDAVGPAGLLALGMRAGKWGIGGLFLASAGELAQFVWPDSARVDSLTHALVFAAAGLALFGLQAHARRATNMIAINGADAAIGRSVIASAIGAPLASGSSDPAVQREITKKLRISNAG